MSSKDYKIKVGFSVGDFNGISTEIIIKALKNKNITTFFTPIIFASGKLFNYQKNVFKVQQTYNYITEPNMAKDGKINMVNLWKDEVKVYFGQPTEASTKMAIDSLNAATEALLKGEIDVLITSPINKNSMMEQGFEHAGHTGFLEEKANQKGLMFLVSDDLKVAVCTHHIPVSEVANNLSKESIIKQVKTLAKTLKQDFCISKPKIALLGLNPHSGDGGKIGKEEIEIISPAIQELNNNDILAFGPYPADSFFQPEKYKNFDAVLAMYHDQGLTPFKTLAYTDGVNFTAGLPFIRTSPDHGVAYDIAGLNKADEKSLSEAIFTAIDIFKNRKEYQELKENELKPQKPPHYNHSKSRKTKKY